MEPITIIALLGVGYLVLQSQSAASTAASSQNTNVLGSLLSTLGNAVKELGSKGSSGGGGSPGSKSGGDDPSGDGGDDDDYGADSDPGTVDLTPSATNTSLLPTTPVDWNLPTQDPSDSAYGSNGGYDSQDDDYSDYEVYDDGGDGDDSDDGDDD